MLDRVSEHQRGIYQIILEKGFASTRELRDALGVSEATVRRYLSDMASEEIVKRVHGGAKLPESSGVELSFRQKLFRNLEEKKRIGRKAAELINDNENIFLETGTTVIQIVPHLRAKKNLTVVTNCLNVAMEVLSIPGVRLIVVGGEVREKSYAFVGPLAEKTLGELFRDIHVDKLFMGADGISAQEGLTTPNIDEARINRKMIELIPERIVVADRSKFGVVALSRIAPLAMIQTIISDSDEGEEVARIRESGVRVLKA